MIIIFHGKYGRNILYNKIPRRTFYEGFTFNIIDCCLTFSFEVNRLRTTVNSLCQCLSSVFSLDFFLYNRYWLSGFSIFVVQLWNKNRLFTPYFYQHYLQRTFCLFCAIASPSSASCFNSEKLISEPELIFLLLPLILLNFLCLIAK